MFSHHHQGCIQDAMVGLVFPKHFHRIEFALFVHHHLELASFWYSERYPFGQRGLVRKAVDDPDELPRFEVDGIVPLFKIIEFLKHCDRNGNIVVVETADRIVVIQNNRGVEDKDLLGLQRFFYHGTGVFCPKVI